MSNSFLESPSLRASFRAGSALAAMIGVRRDIQRLMELSDRELADIGLSRGEIMHAVRYGRLPDYGDDGL